MATVDDMFRKPLAVLMQNCRPLSFQPIPYQGSKRSLAPRICAFFPSRVETLFEPFAGSAAITLFAASHELADRFVIGDVYPPLMSLWCAIIRTPEEIADRYEGLWSAQFKAGPTHFNTIRAAFNEDSDPVKLLYLIARCVKNAVRFNRSGNFTQSVDKRRTGMKPDRFRRTAHKVSGLLKGRTTIVTGPFEESCGSAKSSDLIYMDPPYQGTTYGKDRRYAAGLERDALTRFLREFDHRKVPYLLSYDGLHGNKSYGEPLPDDILAVRHFLNAGRSSQATLNGRSAVTIESLYVSLGLPQTKSYRSDLFEKHLAAA